MRNASFVCPIIALAVMVISGVGQADIYGLQSGKLELKSAGPLAFGPDGILFVGDPKGAQIFAVQTGDKQGDANQVAYDIPELSKEISTALHAATIEINDLIVNPATGNLFLAVVADEKPAIVQVAGGDISPLNLDDIPFSKSVLPNPPEDRVTGEGRRARNNRMSAITDLAFVDGEIIISGLSNSASASNVRSLVFPFNKADRGASLEIFHGAHGRSEDYAPIQTFVPFNINGEPNLLAGFVCTPLVKFPVSQITAGEKIEGTTVAELGNRNRPLDMIVYEQDGSRFLLLANSARGVMKISTEDIERQQGITEPVRGGGKAGQTYVTIESLEGTQQLDKLNETHAVVLIGDHLKSVPLP